MKLYAEVPSLRLRQALFDAGVLLWVYVWVRIGHRIYELVDGLGDAGTRVERSGNGFAQTLDRVAGSVGRVPGVGGTLKAPFRGAADAGRTLADAGAAQDRAVHTLGLWLGIVIAILPIAWLLARYLPGRIRWIREASAAHRFRLTTDDLHLFAMRAVATRPLAQLRRVSADPAGDLERGDYARLAGLELATLGLSVPRLTLRRESPDPAR